MSIIAIIKIITIVLLHDKLIIYYFQKIEHPWKCYLFYVKVKDIN